MKQRLPLVFVLWCQQSDELVAVTALVQHRRAGQRVQLVGLDQRHRRGANGVILAPDLTLGEALPLASRVHSIIFPMALVALRRYLDDPRLVSLLQKALDHGATLVIHEEAANDAIEHLARATQRNIRAALQLVPNPQQ